MKKMNFNDLALSQEMSRAITEMGFTDATPIQAEAIPHLLEGKDLIGQAQTGTGKTAAFGIPLLENLPEGAKHVSALVVCPTRELAIQVAVELRKLAKFKKDASIVAIYGGDSIQKQIQELKRGAQVIVGTPGRIMDHLERRTLSFAQVNTIVLDEADEMLNMGFREDIENILQQMPESRQTVLFSATMPKPIMDIARNYQNKPVHVKVVNEKLTNNSIEQIFFETSNSARPILISRLFEMNSLTRSIVFTNTKRTADELALTLKNLGLSVKAIHGDLNQTQRNQVLTAFRDGSLQVLVATDVAARGIDVNDVDAVFNFDIPLDPEYYVHRIGRTGRAGKTGIAFSFVTGRKDFYRLNDIERYTKAKIEKRQIPTLREVNLLKKQRFMELLTGLVKAGGLDKYESIVKELNDAGISSDDLAAALIKYNLPVEKDVQELPEFVEERRERPDREFRGGAPRNNDSRGNTGNGRPYEKKGGYEKGGYEKRREGGGGDRPRKSRFARA
jgi:ATP-dependent RNA helicase DeaD